MAESGEMEEALRLDDFQEILDVLRINLPEGALNEEIITSSRNSNFIEDAEAIRKDLETGQIQVALKPRLACGKVSEVMRLNQEKKVQEITRVIFFKPRKHSEKTLMQRWEQNISSANCGLKIKDTFEENLTCEQELRTETEMRCLKFKINDYKRQQKIENGFLSGSPACPVEVSGSRISAACREGTSQTAEGNLPSDVQLSLTHQVYYQTLAHKYLLEKVQEPTVNAVLVITEHLDVEEDLLDEDLKFCYGNVSEDTKEIEDLNNFCLKEALPRFLAVLSLIFEKSKIVPLSADEYQQFVGYLLRRNLPRDVLTPEVETSILTGIINAEITVHLECGKIQNAPSHPQYDQTPEGIHILQKVQNTPLSMKIRIGKDIRKQKAEEFPLMGRKHKRQQGEEDQAQTDEDLQNEILHNQGQSDQPEYKMMQHDQKHQHCYKVQKKPRRGEDQEDEVEEEGEEEEYQRYSDDHEVLQGNFYYNYVSEDTRRIEALKDYCRSEALPRFLAVLNLIFEKVD